MRTAGDRVYLKTLEGLKRIDLIVRCVDGRESDPLELDKPLSRPARPRAGLPQDAGARAQRARRRDRAEPGARRLSAGNVPSVCSARSCSSRRPALWLGETEEAPGRHGQSRSHGDPSRTGGHRPPGRRAIRPAGRQPVGPSAAPRCCKKRSSCTAPSSLPRSASASAPPRRSRPRASAAAVRRSAFRRSTADGYTVMPGGLAMAIAPNLAVSLSAPEARTRDVWIVADGEVPPHRSLWQPTIETARVQRSQRVIQSRVADDLFWLGRYSERTDWIMRVLRSALQPTAWRTTPRRRQGAAHAASRRWSMRDEISGTELPSDGETRRRSSGWCGLLISAKNGRRTLDAHARQTLPRRQPDARPAVARSAGACSATSTPAGLAPSPVRRPSGDPRSDRGRPRLARGLQRPHAGEHDPQLRLVVPGDGPPYRAGDNLSEAILSAVRRAARARGGDGRLLFLLELADSYITYRSRYRLDPMLPLVLDSCCSTRPTRAASPIQLAASRGTRRLPQSKQGAGSHRGAAADPVAADRGAPRRRRSLRRPIRCARRAAGRCWASSSDLLPQLTDGHRAALFQSARGAAAPRAHAARARAMIYDVSHRTAYRYTTPVAQSSTSCTCRRAWSSGRASKGTRCSRAGADDPDASGTTTTATASCCSTSSRSTRSCVVHASSTIGVIAARPADLPADHALGDGRDAPVAAPAALDARCRSATPAPPGTRARRARSPTTREPRSRPAARCCRAHGSSSRASTTTSCSTRPRPTSRRRSWKFCASAAACVRISRIWRSPACARCGCRRAMSAATS